MTPILRDQTPIGILVGGGPAPGINSVICSATLEALRQGKEVIGIVDGYKWLVRGDISQVRILRREDVLPAHCRGGSILGTSRANPMREENGEPAGNGISRVVTALKTLGIKHLVTIGGDDTAFSAQKTAEYSEGEIQVAHVPKTIDNDLPLPGEMPTFGFQTAVDIGSRLVANLVEDASTTGRWYVVVAMGRSSGHLALAMGRAAGASLTLIPEEFAGQDVSLDLICRIIDGTIIKSRAQGTAHGVIVVAEGIAELAMADLEKHPLVCAERDEHEHMRLAEVPFPRILKQALEERLRRRGDMTTLTETTIGYELRCAAPVAADLEYTQQLGWGAVRHLLGTGSRYRDAAIVTVQSGRVVAVPLPSMLDPMTGRPVVRRVDMLSDYYLSARSEMVRMESCDTAQNDFSKELAKVAGLSQTSFLAEYSAVCQPCNPSGSRSDFAMMIEEPEDRGAEDFVKQRASLGD